MCPRILELLPPKALPNLLATSSRSRGEVHAFITGIYMTNTVHLATLASMRLPRLRRLGLSASADWQLAKGDWAGLRHFRLSARASEGQLNALLDAVQWPLLQELNLSNNVIEEVAAQSLVNANFSELQAEPGLEGMCT